MGPYKTEKVLHSKGHCHADKAAPYKMGNDFFFYKLCIQKRADN